MNKEQFEAITKWQNKTFPHATTEGMIAHLCEEIIELFVEIRMKGDKKHLEFADCFLLLFGAAAADGMTYEDICNAIDEKMEINRKRQWGLPDQDGVVNHVREEKNPIPHISESIDTVYEIINTACDHPDPEFYKLTCREYGSDHCRYSCSYRKLLGVLSCTDCIGRVGCKWAPSMRYGEVCNHFFIIKKKEDYCPELHNEHCPAFISIYCINHCEHREELKEVKLKAHCDHRNGYKITSEGTYCRDCGFKAE